MGRRSTGSLSSLLVGSAVAGVGLSAGHDFYRSTKKNIGIYIMAAIVLCGTAFGAWNMFRGHNRGPIGSFFLTLVMNAVIVAVSAATFSIAFRIITGKNDADPFPWESILIIQGSLFSIGTLIGLFQRPGRLRNFLVERDNTLFLKKHGFRDVGGKDQTMIDAEGNELKLDDYRDDAIMFRVVGRRGVRSKIIKDKHGRMLEYIAP